MTHGKRLTLGIEGSKMRHNLPLLLLKGVRTPTGMLEVSFEVSTGEDSTEREWLGKIVGTFAEVGKRGGYSLPDTEPNQSRLTLLSELFTQTNFPMCKFEAVRVTPRSFQLLRNMAGRLKIYHVEVHRILVHNLGQETGISEEAPEPRDSNEEEIYPAASSQIWFELQKDEIPTSRVRQCLVEFHEPPEARHVLEISHWIQPWFDLLEAGAFAMPVGLPEWTESIGGSVTQFDEMTIEIAIDRFEASESAWNVLINLLDVYNRSSFPVEKVIIN
jgi:hypothetical protein